MLIWMLNFNTCWMNPVAKVRNQRNSIAFFKFLYFKYINKSQTHKNVSCIFNCTGDTKSEHPNTELTIWIYYTNTIQIFGYSFTSLAKIFRSREKAIYPSLSVIDFTLFKFRSYYFWCVVVINGRLPFCHIPVRRIVIRVRETCSSRAYEPEALFQHIRILRCVASRQAFD